MKQAAIDACLIPSGDEHASEYVHPHYQCRAFFSGFDGSAGTLLVTAWEALLWTDGRYFLQAERQLAGSGITLQRSGEEGVPTLFQYLAARALARPFVLGFDGRVVSAAAGRQLREELEPKGCRLVTEFDPAAGIWNDRPAIVPSRIVPLPPEVTGRSAAEKLADLRGKMRAAGVDVLFLSDLTETAWTFNLRGRDVACTPVFFSYARIGLEDSTLYVTAPEQLPVPTREALAEADSGRLRTAACTEAARDLQALPAGTRLWIDPATVNTALRAAVPSSVQVREEPTPAALLKAVKNAAEIRSTERAHHRDGLTMVRFLYRLKEEMRHLEEETAGTAKAGAAGTAKAGAAGTAKAGGPEITEAGAGGASDAGAGIAITGAAGVSDAAAGGAPRTEMRAAACLDALRRQHGCYDLSFPTISGYGAHGAVIHYQATPETDAPLAPRGFLLVDSGGQYADGTTDITRTIALGPLTAKMREYYTYVLQAHIALATARFAPGTAGHELDRLARQPLAAHGLDFNHGTGHGVGHLLSVHEGPNTISRHRADCPLQPGMITSDEPGVYLENEFGIRLENELLTIEESGQYAFRPLTLCPFERAAIEPALLTEAERSWVDRYHRWVYEELAPDLPEAERAWLRQQTRPLSR
jgi:Xaa-Pro aminopeptidase